MAPRALLGASEESEDAPLRSDPPSRDQTYEQRRRSARRRGPRTSDKEKRPARNPIYADAERPVDPRSDHGQALMFMNDFARATGTQVGRVPKNYFEDKIKQLDENARKFRADKKRWGVGGTQ